MVDVSEDDTDLREYIQDSIQFITFAVYLEQEFELELPEDLLLIDSLASLNNFSQRVCDIIERNMVTTK